MCTIMQKYPMGPTPSQLKLHIRTKHPELYKSLAYIIPSDKMVYVKRLQSCNKNIYFVVTRLNKKKGHCIVLIIHPNSFELFDPLGMLTQPDRSTIGFLKRHKCSINLERIMSLNGKNCSFYCILYCLLRFKYKLDSCNVLKLLIQFDYNVWSAFHI